MRVLRLMACEVKAGDLVVDTSGETHVAGEVDIVQYRREVVIHATDVEDLALIVDKELRLDVYRRETAHVG